MRFIIVVGLLVSPYCQSLVGRQEVAAQETGKAARSVRGKESAAIDRHALAAPAAAEKSVPALADYLVQPAKKDRDKVRAIFRWMSDRIAYDAENFLAGKPAAASKPAMVLQARKTMCDGYANLFEQLCQAGGLEAVKIQGYAKGFGYQPGEKLSTNHSWNAVKIDGKWQLVDVTWGSGYTDATKGYIKRLEEFYFLTPPEWLAISHLPKETRWQLLDPPLNQAVFMKWPKIDLDYFWLGIGKNDVVRELSRPDFRGLVRPSAYEEADIKVLQAPLTKHVRAGKEYTFILETPHCSKVAFVQGNRFVDFTMGRAGVFEGKITPRAGELLVSAEIPGQRGRYWTILEYVVEE